MIYDGLHLYLNIRNLIEHTGHSSTENSEILNWNDIIGYYWISTWFVITMFIFDQVARMQTVSDLIYDGPQYTAHHVIYDSNVVHNWNATGPRYEW